MLACSYSWREDTHSHWHWHGGGEAGGHREPPLPLFPRFPVLAGSPLASWFDVQLGDADVRRAPPSPMPRADGPLSEGDADVI